MFLETPNQNEKERQKKALSQHPTLNPSQKGTCHGFIPLLRGVRGVLFFWKSLTTLKGLNVKSHW
jgi:hypothetical protein